MKIIVFKNGNTRELTGEEGKYWLMGEDRVRKLSQEISEIREIEVPEQEEAREQEPAPVKKRAASKKKKAAEAKDDGDSGE